MGFTDHKGKKLSERDARKVREMFDGSLDGVRKLIEYLRDDQYTRNKKYYDPILEELRLCTEEFGEAFREAAAGEANVDFREFYTGRMRQLHKRIMEKATPKGREFGDLREFFGGPFQRMFEQAPELKDTREGLLRSTAGFRLASKPMEGVGELGEIRPGAADLSILNTVRSGNSGTLKESKSAPQTKKAQTAVFGYRSGLTLTKVRADELAQRKEVTFADLFDVFCDINRTLRPDDPRSGKVRFEPIRANNLIGLEGLAVPGHLYETLSDTAEYMNRIRRQTDPLLRRTQAIQLAAYVYQVLLSEHVFDDGNGRSSRFFADVILQSFGLPPHTPNAGEFTAVATIGKELDFDRGAKLFLEGVRKSDELLRSGAGRDPEKQKALAERHLKNEFMDPKLADRMGSMNALALAVTVNETKHCLIESVCDLIAANHLFARDSDEYKALVSTSVRFAETLYRNPLNSDATRAGLEQMKKCAAAYVKHCAENKRYDSTRKARIRAVDEMEDLLSHLSDHASQIDREERQPYMDRAEALRTACAERFGNAEKRGEAAAEFIYLTGLVDDMKRVPPRLKPAQLETALSGEGIAQGVRKIREGGHLDRAIAEGIEKYADKTPRQQLVEISIGHERQLRAARRAKAAETQNTEAKTKEPTLS